MTPSSAARAANCAGLCARYCIARNSPTSGSSSASCCAIAPSLPPHLKELAILVTGRHCHAQLEWYIHAQMALKAGLPQAVIDDVHAGRRPAGVDADGLCGVRLCRGAQSRKTVSEATYRRVLDRLAGWSAWWNSTALIGYYTMVAMTLNCHDIPLPDGVRRRCRRLRDRSEQSWHAVRYAAQAGIQCVALRTA